MSELEPVPRETAIAEAVRLARELGLHVDDEPELLNARHNLVLGLRPAPIVARVAWITSLIRGPESAADSIGLASFLADAGVPVTRPARAIVPGPHVAPSGCTITLWERVAVTNEAPDPAAVGAGLARVHRAAAAYEGPLAPLDPLGEAAAVAELVARWLPDEAARVHRLAAALVMPPLPVQPIHGDAGAHNAFVTPGGLVWGDWEECAQGPVAWDLASLANHAQVPGERVRETDAAVAAYGPHDGAAVAAMAPIFATWAAAWGLLAHVRDRSPVAEATLRQLECAEERA